MCRSVPLVLMAVALTACATTPARPGATVARLQLDSHVSSVQVTNSELLRTRGASNALAALERLRPGFRNTLRGISVAGMPPAAPAVFINGVYAGPIDVLMSISVEEVGSIRLMRAMEASFAYGARIGNGGAILVTLRRDD